MEWQSPPCSRFAPPCYQASSWQQWMRPQQHQKCPILDNDDDVCLERLRKSIGAPPGLEINGLGGPLVDAPSTPMPITPPPLPFPRYVTPSLKLLEDVGTGSSQFFLMDTDTDSVASSGLFSGQEPYPPSLVDRSSGEATSAVWSQTSEESPSLFFNNKGSQKHDKGKCTPCHFFQRKQGCINGAKCRYCHLHDDMRDRPDKRSRGKARKEVDEWEQKECDSQTKIVIAAKMATKDAYTKMLLQRRLKAMDDKAQMSFQQVAAGAIEQFA